MSESAHDLLVRGIAALKAKEMREASFYLDRVLTNEPDLQQSIEAWLGLCEISTDPVEQRNLLESVLSNDPTEGRARRKLAILDGKLKPDEIVDPDHLTQPAPNTQEANDPKRFICPKCGGRMTFTPDGSSLTCEFCQSRQSLSVSSQESQNIPERDFFLAMATSRAHFSPVVQRTLSCQGCGARFLLTADQITLNCPYCNSSYVVENKETFEMILPAGLIPFEIDEEHAKQSLRNWLQKNLSDKPVHVIPGTALYVPIWSFDLTGQITWRCQVYKNKMWIDEHGECPILYQDIRVNGTKNLKECEPEFLREFSHDKIVSYDDRYLANWPAETYQITMADASLEARQLVLAIESEQVRRSFMSQSRDLGFNTSGMAVDAYELLLFPFWITRYTLENQSYQIIINGQNGAIHGQRPAGKVAQWLDRIIG
jgi:uncharacterized CHY-type Zn-finger protein